MRGDGHGLAGFGTNDGGVVIDLSKDVAAIYPTQTHERLAAVKRQYDPGNLFARNHNVRPQ